MRITTTISILNYNLILIKKKINYVYIYNKDFYFLFYTPLNVVVEENTNTLILNNLDSDTKKKFEKNLIEIFIKTWNTFFFQKIKFTGKGYKIKKKKKSIKFFFGRSHLTNIYFKNLKLKRLTKYKIFIYTKKYEIIKHVGRLLFKIRNLNIFTKRGLRFARQKVYKKTGKKSSYM